MAARATPHVTPRPLRDLQPAPPRPVLLHPSAVAAASPPPPTGTCFFDLPAEIRIQIYTLILENVIIHITPTARPSSPHATATINNSEDKGSSSSNDASMQHHPHALLLTSRQIRLETQPLMQSLCPIKAAVTDFDFSGLLTWLARIPSAQQSQLTKNTRLCVQLCTTSKVPGDLPTLRRWLHDRADKCRPVMKWNYSGARPSNKVGSDLRRRLKRMKEAGKRGELERMLIAIRVSVPRLGESGEEGEEEDEL
ncbi:hypothetical protein BDY17DRAFT_154784 [Neohortaea acidophila]|uniref:2EXR domain-containing protein n=1 Tax=Neohortaea acidophila TaxID=245834 RepID=A0A6A6PVM2_9PEZI|nr:uncharacterized protein BDY17DRAFT_154784 [Neohortaea acidophila]KAF2483781.1 hypothetical protein BDY17DRAFT_154784 [Neohortaea acidophila]